MAGGRYEVVTLGFSSNREAYRVERVIGHDPLRQFLVAAPGGRLQVLEASWDPHKKEWFNVYGQEDRLPGEWGHWTGRGMNWNSMCAFCHNTRLRKNYDPATDTWQHHAPMPTPRTGRPSTLASQRKSSIRLTSRCTPSSPGAAAKEWR